MFRILLYVLVLTSSFSVYSENIEQLLKQANQSNPEAQYELAMAYQSGKSTDKNPQEAFYWLQQSANSQYPPAIFQLAENYLSGTGTDKNISQVIYLLTELATKGDAAAQFKLGEIYQGLELAPTASELAELWYHISADKLPQAEEAYSKILEQKYNQQRAKQVSSIQKLDTIIDNQISASRSDSSQLPSSDELGQDYVLIAIITLLLLVTLSIYKISRNKKLASSQSEKQNQQLISDSSATIKKQKRQLDTLYKELKRYQKHQQDSVNNQKYQLACAMFGYPPQQVPSEKEIKVRYKQLCKIYHPDMKGSDEEMKRLNGALKTILTNVNNS